MRQQRHTHAGARFQFRAAGNFLAQAAAGQQRYRFAPLDRQRAGIGGAGACIVVLGGMHMAQFFPCLGAGPVRQRLLQLGLGLAPDLLVPAQLTQGHQQSRILRVVDQPGFSHFQR